MVEIIIYAIIITVLFFWFRKQSKDKTAFGINLKTVYCPVCGTKQPRFRIATNFSQAMVGGTICPKCKTKLDKYGDIIP